MNRQRVRVGTRKIQRCQKISNASSKGDKSRKCGSIRKRVFANGANGGGKQPRVAARRAVDKWTAGGPDDAGRETPKTVGVEERESHPPCEKGKEIRRKEQRT